VKESAGLDDTFEKTGCPRGRGRPGEEKSEKKKEEEK
jgi:hypothetical protein